VDTLELKIKLTAQGMQLTSLIVLCKISSKSLSLSLFVYLHLYTHKHARARARAKLCGSLGCFLFGFSRSSSKNDGNVRASVTDPRESKGLLKTQQLVVHIQGVS